MKSFTQFTQLLFIVWLGAMVLTVIAEAFVPMEIMGEVETVMAYSIFGIIALAVFEAVRKIYRREA